MTDIILRDQSIAQEMDKPWVRRQVGSYLANIKGWIEHGYRLTEQQLELIEKIQMMGNDHSV